MATKIDKIPDNTPEAYVDQFSLAVSAFTVMLVLGHSDPSQPGVQKPVSVVIQSPQHAKVLAMLLRKSMKDWERANGCMIGVPVAVMNELSIAPEDW